MKKLKEFICRDGVKIRERIFIVATLVSSLLLAISFESKLLFILSAPLLLLTIIYALLAFRCPHCDAFLGTRMTIFVHCPKCGKEIEKE